MQGFGDHKKSQKKIKKDFRNNNLKEQIIYKAFKFHSEGNIVEANKYYKFFISQGFTDVKVFSNYGVLLKGLGKLKEAELSTRKAIKLNPDYAIAHSNLGGILKDLGKLKEAELSTRKAIELNPDYPDAYSNLGIILKDLGKLKEAELAMLKAIELNPDFAGAYFSLSTFNYSNKNKLWKEKLFSEELLENKMIREQVDIYFARANILHNEKKYQESSSYLKLANKLKLNLKKSKSKYRINKSKILLIESEKKEIDQKEYTNCPQSIFIVGMPRSGSTLIESIISMNNDVFDLGETNILEEAFIEKKNSNHELPLTDIYLKKISEYKKNFKVTTNKYLYNYQYAGIISKQIANAKIIHCFRNPLDNILSIYRANFATGTNEYSSSLADCTSIYLDQEEIMSKYKSKFKSKIYDLNYDLLVSDPNKEIKSLISWLDWQWEDSYLSPHLNKRSVFTASQVQVRSPINSKSVGGWKNYKEMLKPSIEILSKTRKYKNVFNQS